MLGRLLLTFFLVLGTLLGHAASFRADGPTLFVNEMPVFSLKSKQDGYSPEKRIAMIAATLTKGPMGLPLQIVTKGSDVWIYHQETRVVRITKAEANLHKSSQDKLAADWKGALEKALQLPPLVVEPQAVAVKAWEKALVKVMGERALDAEATTADNSVATVARVSGGFEIEGVDEGETVVRISAGGTTVTVKVVVGPATVSAVTAVLSTEPVKPILPKVTPSVVVAPTLTAEAIGSPASAESVRRAAAAVALRWAADQGNGGAEVLRVSAQPLPAGRSQMVKVFLNISTSNDQTQDLPVTVRVYNPGLNLAKETTLWFCNSPERVVDENLLFQQSLKPSDPVRMLFHHVNGARRALAMQVIAYNLSAQPAQLILVKGEGEPALNPTKVGMEAGTAFLHRWLNRESEQIEIPPRTAVPLSLNYLSPGQTGSGLVYLALRDGGASRVVVRAETVEPSSIASAWRIASFEAAALYAPVPFEKNPEPSEPKGEVFASPFRENLAQYEVGGKQAFSRIGQVPINSVSGDGGLSGNFGVIYTVQVKLSNPTTKPEQVEIVHEASAGYSGVVYALNGKVIEPQLIQTKAEFLLTRVKLEPGEKRDLTIQTLPLSGSHYPATLIVREATSLQGPATPRIFDSTTLGNRPRGTR